MLAGDRLVFAPSPAAPGPLLGLLDILLLCIDFFVLAIRFRYVERPSAQCFSGTTCHSSEMRKRSYMPLEENNGT
jgi:hypothetical protein